MALLVNGKMRTGPQNQEKIDKLFIDKGSHKEKIKIMIIFMIRPKLQLLTQSTK